MATDPHHQFFREAEYPRIFPDTLRVESPLVSSPRMSSLLDVAVWGPVVFQYPGKHLFFLLGSQFQPRFMISFEGGTLL